MLRNAVLVGCKLGTELLQRVTTESGGKKWEEGIAFLTTALEDAATYLEEAPADVPDIDSVAQWYILLMILIRDQISDDLREVQVGCPESTVVFLMSSPPRLLLCSARRHQHRTLWRIQQISRHPYSEDIPMPPPTTHRQTIHGCYPNLRTPVRANIRSG